MTTDKIIRDEFDKRVSIIYRNKELLHSWFAAGWRDSEQWHERQAMMDRDSLEQTREEANLAGGLG